jgi:integrase
MLRQHKVPKYALHKPSGQARVTVGGERIYLGAFNSHVSLQRYREIVARWQTRQPARSIPDISIGELAILYNEHVKSHYVKAGRPTSEQHCIRSALRLLLATERYTLVRDFGPKRLNAVRDAMVDSGQARKSINKHISRIRRLFRWGVAEELVSADVLAAISALDGLKAGRSRAAEKLPVRPALLRDVVAIRKHVPPQVYAMIRLQIRTGMRPGEVVRLRTCDLDCSGPAWRYAVIGHKTEHHGRERIVFIGPKAQRTLASFLRPDAPDAFIFPARDVLVERGDIPRAGRQRAPGARYTVNSYRRAVQRACEKLGYSDLVSESVAAQRRNGSPAKVGSRHRPDCARAFDRGDE